MGIYASHVKEGIFYIGTTIYFCNKVIAITICTEIIIVEMVLREDIEPGTRVGGVNDLTDAILDINDY